jgi:uncharacterized RDD family membrane protein YckC
MNTHKEKIHEISENNFVGSTKRSIASAIDTVIVLIVRILFIEIIGKIWIEPILLKFNAEFKEKFGTETPKRTPEHIEFMYQHELFYHIFALFVIIVLIGTLYHSALNSSSWRATIGKRLMGIAIVKNNLMPLSFKRALLHYFLSILPFFYIFYIISYQMKNDVEIYQAITGSYENIAFGIIFMLWLQIHLFTKNKTTAYDLICNTIFINKIFDAKMPWSKIKKNSIN